MQVKLSDLYLYQKYYFVSKSIPILLSMNLRKLTCFLTLSEELHFGRAAEKLYMAQPPLSRIIRELEEELDATLFTRNSRKVELTKAGAYLKEEAKKLFVYVGQIKKQLKQIVQGKTGKLRIGYVGAAMHSVLPGILIALKEELEINIFLSELKNEEQVACLIDDRIDLGFVRSVPELRDIQAIKVFTESFSIILPKDHRLASKKRISLEQFAQEPFIGLNYDCAPKLCDSINAICRKAGFLPTVAHETSQINSIVRLVESGMGYSIVPSSVKLAYSVNLKFIDLNQYRERAHLFVMHKKEMDPLIKRSVEIVRDFTATNRTKNISVLT